MTDTPPLKPIIEALLFASEVPLSLREFCRILLEDQSEAGGEGQGEGIPLWSPGDIETALAEMLAQYGEDDSRGFYMVEVAGGYQFRSKPTYASYLRRLQKEKPYRISRSCMEVLSIVAYRQPVTRPQIDEIRGVDSSAALRTLLERGLVRPLGQSEEVGHPTLFGTTSLFLEVFNLKDLESLPPFEEPSSAAAPSIPSPLEGEGQGEGDLSSQSLPSVPASLHPDHVESLFKAEFLRISEEVAQDQGLIEELDTELGRLGDVQTRVMETAFPVSATETPKPE